MRLLAGLVFAPLLAGLAALPVRADPPAATTAYLDVSLRYQRGRVSVERVTRGAFPSPTVLKRYVGRFEARVSARGRQVDAVRFDFPLLGDADAGNQGPLAERVKANVVTTARVRVPLPDGADQVAVLDSKGGPPIPVPLPAAARPDGGGPTDPPDAGPGDAPRRP
ncbi:MAG: hypothetical protein EXR72_04575 [Myxococcales bacterium]|nr:hypothetical protein [Myxococcales bacterium]